MPRLALRDTNARAPQLEPTPYEKWTRDQKPGQVLRLAFTGVPEVIRLSPEKSKRADQLAPMFKGAPKEVFDLAVQRAEVDDEGVSDIVARAKISTERVDTYKSTLNVEGWELSDYKRNPVVLFAHESWELPVGRDIGAFADLDVRALYGITRFVGPALGEDEAKVGRWVAAGMLNATSVGFMPLEWEVDEERDDGESWWLPIRYLRQALHEYSWVPVPANADCLVDGRAAEKMGISKRELREMLEQALDSSEVFYIPRAQLLQLKRSNLGASIAVDMGALGVFDVRLMTEQVINQEPSSAAPSDEQRADGDLACPACGHEGPAAEFATEKAADTEDDSDDGADLDETGESGQDDQDARDIAGMAEQVVSLVQSGRLP